MCFSGDKQGTVCLKSWSPHLKIYKETPDKDALSSCVLFRLMYLAVGKLYQRISQNLEVAYLQQHCFFFHFWMTISYIICKCNSRSSFFFSERGIHVLYISFLTLMFSGNKKVMMLIKRGYIWLLLNHCSCIFDIVLWPLLF